MQNVNLFDIQGKNPSKGDSVLCIDFLENISNNDIDSGFSPKEEDAKDYRKYGNSYYDSIERNGVKALYNIRQAHGYIVEEGQATHYSLLKLNSLTYSIDNYEPDDENPYYNIYGFRDYTEEEDYRELECEQINVREEIVDSLDVYLDSIKNFFENIEEIITILKLKLLSKRNGRLFDLKSKLSFISSRWRFSLKRLVDKAIGFSYFKDDNIA